MVVDPAYHCCMLPFCTYCCFHATRSSSRPLSSCEAAWSGGVSTGGFGGFDRRPSRAVSGVSEVSSVGVCRAVCDCVSRDASPSVCGGVLFCWVCRQRSGVDQYYRLKRETSLRPRLRSPGRGAGRAPGPPRAGGRRARAARRVGAHDQTWAFRRSHTWRQSTSLDVL